MKWWQWLLAAFVGLAVISALASPEEDGGEDKADPDNGDPIEAQVLCESAVEDQLKAPDTADFSDVEAARTKGSKFVVKGAVDSENSFGANLRAFWICDAEYIRGETYRVKATVLE